MELIGLEYVLEGLKQLVTGRNRGPSKEEREFAVASFGAP